MAIARLLAISAAYLGIGAAIAWADFPPALRGTFAFGPGRASHQGTSSGFAGGVATLDLLWRLGPGNALVMSYETGALSPYGAIIDPDPFAPRLFDVAQRSILIGLEWSRPKPGTSSFLGAGLGAGRLDAHVRGGHNASMGVAANAWTGVRIVPNPAVFGLVLGVRTSNVFTGESHAHALMLFLGLALSDPGSGQ